MGGFARICDDPHSCRAQPPRNELRTGVAKFGGSPIPDIGLAQIRFDMRAATIEFGQGEDGAQVVLFAGSPKVALGANEVLRQPIAVEPHEPRSAEALRIVRLGRLFKIFASGLLVLWAPLTGQADR